MTYILKRRKKRGPFYVDMRVGGVRIRRSLGVTDRRAAERLALDAHREAEQAHAGIVDPVARHGLVPIRQHIEAFLVHLRAEMVTDGHQRQRERNLRAFIASQKVELLSDFTLDAVEAWMVEEAAAGWGARTLQTRRAAVKQFARWAVDTKRLAHDPLLRMRKINVETDRRRVRRALTHSEVEALLGAARDRPLACATKERVHAGVTPGERARLVFLGSVRVVAYRLALGAGLRRNEVRTLKWGALQGGDLVLEASNTKSKKVQRVPVGESLAALLSAHRLRARAASKPVGEGDPIIPERMMPSARAFRRDLVCAQIERVDASGRVADFHGLRHTFITRLSEGGVHPRVAQELARHATIEMTMRFYTHLRSNDLRAAVEHAGVRKRVTAGVTKDVRKGPISASSGPKVHGAKGFAESALEVNSAANTA